MLEILEDGGNNRMSCIEGLQMLAQPTDIKIIALHESCI